MADDADAIPKTVARLLAAAPPQSGVTGARHGIEVAASVIGLAEAQAMRHASTLAGSGVDAMPLLDAGAYRAMTASGGGGSDELWAIWTLARARARISTMIDDDAAPDLVAVSALLDAAHAVLAGRSHDRAGRAELRDTCRAAAVTDSRTAAVVLGDLTAAG